MYQVEKKTLTNFFFQFEIIINILASSTLFKFLSHGSTSFRNSFTLTVWRLSPSDSEVDPRAVGVNPYVAILLHLFFTLKLCLTTATHSFKWVKIAHIC